MYLAGFLTLHIDFWQRGTICLIFLDIFVFGNLLNESSKQNNNQCLNMLPQCRPSVWRYQQTDLYTSYYIRFLEWTWLSFLHSRNSVYPIK